MPKGRRFVPSSANEGVWFHHRGLPEAGPPRRLQDTTTGTMLAATKDPLASLYPPQPPRPYQHKDTGSFKTANLFSTHDNRHHFQDHGVYFEDGRQNRLLGKRNTAPTVRQHFTDPAYLTHQGRVVSNYDYDTVYGVHYKGSPTKEAPTKRRFARNHPEGNTGLAKLDTATTDWFKEPQVPYKTPLQVMATSQEPFLDSNAWKYSYHGLSKCYPPYDCVAAKKPYPSWLIHGQQGRAQAEVEVHS